MPVRHAKHHATRQHCPHATHMGSMLPYGTRLHVELHVFRTIRALRHAVLCYATPSHIVLHVPIKVAHP